MVVWYVVCAGQAPGCLSLMLQNLLLLNTQGVHLTPGSMSIAAVLVQERVAQAKALHKE